LDPDDVTNVVFLSLGGNMGNREALLRRAITAVSEKCGGVVACSSVYETAPWGSDSCNPFLNLVIKLTSPLAPEALLAAIRTIETDLGRERGDNKNADRTIDLDILLYNDLVMNTDFLELPHPRMHLRKFVLVPLAEIAPEEVHPVLRQNIATLLKNCSDALEVTHFKNW
jgi:2-amino-4-hydroxy-6-hydroxymethyldihydropteridine diphosphokinase